MRKFVLGVGLLVLAFVGWNIYLANEKVDVNFAKPSEYGSRSIYLTDFEDVSEDMANVFFMGNSVYQHTRVLKELYHIQKNGEFHFDMGNFSFTGASVYDYLFTYNHLKSYNPDLLVIHVSPVTFGRDWPNFRNDGYQGLFKPKNIKLLGEKFIHKLYTKEEYAHALVSSFIPVVEHINVIRHKVFSRLRSKKQSTESIWNFFKIKNLNVALDWKKERSIEKSKIPVSEENHEEHNLNYDPETMQYLSAEEAFDYLLAQLDSDNQPTLIIEQSSSYESLPLFNKIKSKAAAYEQIFYVSNKEYYDKAAFRDEIHPRSAEAKASAKRHYDLITLIMED